MQRQTCKAALNRHILCIIAAMAVILGGLNSGCRRRQEPEPADSNETEATPDIESNDNTSTPNEDTSTKTDDIPRFATNSPFDVNFTSPVPEKEKRLWARSCLWEKAPDFVVEKWLGEKPDTTGPFISGDGSPEDAMGKYVLLEFWATWCSQCRRAVPFLNQLHEKFKEYLLVIGISNEKEETVRKLTQPKIEYYVAIDTQARMKNQLGVYGIPHILIVEPGGYVVWEGFPFLRGYELTEEVVEKIISVGRKSKQSPASGQ